MRWEAAVSGASTSDKAAREVAEELAFRLGEASPDLVFVTVSVHHRGALEAIGRVQSERFPGALIVGASGSGIIGDGRELEGRPGVATLAGVLPGVRLHPLRLSPGEAPVPPVGPPLAGWVLLVDPFSVASETLLSEFDAVYPGVPKVGGLISGGRRRGSNALLLGDEVFHDGALALGLSGPLAFELVIAQGCRPLGPTWVATKTAGSEILELDGRPALDALGTLVGDTPEEERERLLKNLVLGLRPDGEALMRTILGVDPSRSALVVGARIEEGERLRFHVRDAETARRELAAKLTAVEPGNGIAAALLFTCTGRGADLFGHPDHDTDAFRRQFGGVPLGGLFCGGEFGTRRDRTDLFGFTSSLALIRAL